MTSFSNVENFDAVAYLNNRPQYSKTYVELIKAWHEVGRGRFHDALDIGCGPGQMAYHLAQSFENVVGIDPSPLMLRAAQDSSAVLHVLGLQVPSGHEVTFREATGQHTGLPDQSFDLINAATSAHWFPWREDPTGETIWREMARLLRPGGALVFGGYMSIHIRGHDLIADRMEDFFESPDGWRAYFGFEDDLSPTKIGATYYKTMPPPLEPYFDASQTTILRFQVRMNSHITREDIVPVPPWATQAGVQSHEEPPLVTQKGSLRRLALFMRSVSAWPRYLDDHPEEKELQARDQDLPFRLVEEWRREEAQQTGKLLGWDEELEFVYPTTMLFARKR